MLLAHATQGCGGTGGRAPLPSVCVTYDPGLVTTSGGCEDLACEERWPVGSTAVRAQPGPRQRASVWPAPTRHVQPGRRRLPRSQGLDVTFLAQVRQVERVSVGQPFFISPLQLPNFLPQPYQ